MTRLLVRYPASYEPERRYAIDVVLGTLLGLDHRAEPHDGAGAAIALEGAGDGRKVTVADGLFALPESEWLEPASLPGGPRPAAARVARRPDLDPYDTFDLIMDATESLGARSAFYFIAGRTAGRLDGDHDLRDPWVMGLVRRVAERGHEVGLHPSYGSFRDPAQVRRELERLLAAADELGVGQDEWGGRQHFLRWEAPTTWRAWADAGLAYDSSLGYADRVGFRSGTCHEHEVFDLRARRRLPLRERPLVVMEATLLERKYMGLGHEAAVETARRLRATCERFGGDFTLLWHNSYLLTAADRQAFRRVIA